MSVTDANGCGANITLPLLTDSSRLLRATVASITKASCNTSASGAVSVNVSGGATPYTYNWSPGGASTKDLSGVVPGVYNLTVTDALGCTANLSAAVTIDSPAALKVVLDSTKASGCSSSATGAVYITASAGTAPYTYDWRKSGVFVSAAADLVNVVAGSYTVTVTDASGCSATLNASVGVLPGTINVVQDSVKRPTCTLSGDGAVYTSVSGGLAPYTYSWSSGQTTDDITGVNAGTYVITATDANGCPGQLIVTLNYDTAKTVKVVTDSLRGAACAAGTGAAIYVTASGGTAPYAYAWSTGSSMEDLMNVPVGAYRLTVTDARGCKVNLDVNTAVDTARSLRLIVNSTQGAACIGSKTGSINTDVTRGTAPYTFLWSTGAVGKTLTNVAPGSYTVTVMDGEGCSSLLTASVGIDTAKRVRIASDSMRGAGCAAGNNGGLFVSVSGGTPGYTYLWSDGSVMEDLVNAKPGLYSLRVQDVYGCTAEYSGNITVDPAKAINVTTATVTDAACSGNASGAIDINVSGGQAPYSYDWSNGATTKVVSGLVPGSYTVKVTDAAGCTGELSVNIKVDTMNKIKLSVMSQTAARCTGSASGAVTVKVEGGLAPYSYSWSNGAKTKDLSYVSPGSYLLTVTDAQGCSADLSVVIGIDASNPVKAAIDSVRGVGCGDTLSGAVYASASGGVPPYSYLWSTGAITKDLVNIAKGSYMLTVTDDAGCSAAVSAVVAPVSALQISASVTPVDCYGNTSGAATVLATNGSGNYSYIWSDGVSGAARAGLKAGSYSVTATDQQTKCTADTNLQITQNDSLMLSLTVQSDSCLPGADGSITVHISGGTTPYNFAWSNGMVSQDLQGLEAGSYTLNVTDARGCAASAAAQVATIDCNTDVVVHDVLTPNGDGMNDAFFIEGIVFYPQNKLQIVDKWGDLVYERSPYDNSFTGMNSKTGDALPTGTYYYILQLNAPGKTKEQNTFKGAVLLKR
ncbi:MAG: gliding motility-associated C-terminal domain-containing protein [Chitinophagaceae bacterium]